jgi:hypothetical protein
MLTVAWGKRSAAPGGTSAGLRWLKANFTSFGQEGGDDEIGFQPIEGTFFEILGQRSACPRLR